MIKEEFVKLERQPRWVLRIFMLLGAVLGGVSAFVFSPIGGINAQSITCPVGQYLATGGVCITNDKDIVIQATATEANQTLKINKYFANAYTVDRGDGTTGNLTADTTHTYSDTGTYNIILSLTGGAERWRFVESLNPLIPKTGTTLTGVKIMYMPSLADGFGDSVTNPGNFFFHSFNYLGCIISVPEGSFDTSNINAVGEGFFKAFNDLGYLESLPEGSFDISNITTAGKHFFSRFNYCGKLRSLPEGSFRTENLTIVDDFFFTSFNLDGQLESLPEGSFNTLNIETVGEKFFHNFNYKGKLTSLPEGSFDTSNIKGKVGDYFFMGFNSYGKLESLPEGSFRIGNITQVGDEFFASFNQSGLLESLPEGSFDISNITGIVGDYFFGYFNYKGKLESLPEGSFDTSKISIVGNDFFSAFNPLGSLTSLPEGSFDISNITSVGDNFFAWFNYWGVLTNLPADSFDTSNIMTVGDNFFSEFNEEGTITSLPDGSFDTSNIMSVGNDFFAWFNYDGKITSLPNSFSISSVGVSVTNGYKGAFNSSSYTLNKNVSDLVSGVVAPGEDRNIFSDNQPGRCGVHENRLVNPAVSCDVVTVTFYTDEGLVLEIITGYNGDILKTPENLIKTGYKFKGRYETGSSNAFDFSVGVTGNVDVYANWDVNKYTITFVDGGGENGSIIWTGEYGENVTVDYPSWTKGGYTISWDKEIPAIVPAGNIIITASWTKNNGGGRIKKKDYCPDGDYSDSYYDGDCGTSNLSGDNDDEIQDTKDEMISAYEWAFENGITTMDTIEKADLNGNLTRIAMAKMLSQYAINILGMEPDQTREKIFDDVSEKLDFDYDNCVTYAYQLGIMGINMGDNFRPFDLVPRSEFVTAFSRMKYNTLDGKDIYYSTHMELLHKLGIIEVVDPKMLELRGYVMLMLMRSEND